MSIALNSAEKPNEIVENGVSPMSGIDQALVMACNMMRASALEGVQAFIDKRRPRWD